MSTRSTQLSEREVRDRMASAPCRRCRQAVPDSAADPVVPPQPEFTRGSMVEERARPRLTGPASNRAVPWRSCAPVSARRVPHRRYRCATERTQVNALLCPCVRGLVTDGPSGRRGNREAAPAPPPASRSTGGSGRELEALHPVGFHYAYIVEDVGMMSATQGQTPSRQRPLHRKSDRQRHRARSGRAALWMAFEPGAGSASGSGVRGSRHILARLCWEPTIRSINVSLMPSASAPCGTVWGRRSRSRMCLPSAFLRA